MLPPAGEMMGGIGFGLERIGLAALARPRLAALFIAALTALSIFGMTRLSFDDDVVRALRSDSDSYRAFTELEAQHGAAINNVVVLAESDHDLTADDLKALREFHFELEFVDGVDAVLSMFSQREIGPGLEPGAALVPDEFTDGDVPGLIERARSDTHVSGHAVSTDGRSLVFVLVDDASRETRNARRAYVEDIAAAAAKVERPGIGLTVLGYDQIRFEIADSVLRDVRLFAGGGFVIALLLSGLWFGNWRLTAITFAQNALAVVWSLGMAGLVGVPIAVTTDIVPVLILVISFTDAMHLVHALRRQTVASHENLAAAIADTLRHIGPACALTSLTTAASIAALALTGYGALNDLAIFGGIGALIAFLAVITVFPVAALALARPSDLGRPATGMRSGRRVFAAVARFVPPHRRSIIAGALALFALSLWGQATTHATFSSYENLPENGATVRASLRAEREFGGVFHVWTGIAPTAAPSVGDWQRLVSLHEAAEKAAAPNAVTSMVTLARAAGHPETPLSQAEIERVPEWFLERFADYGPGRMAVAIASGDPGGAPEVRDRFDAVEAAALSAGGMALAGTPALTRHDGPRLIHNLAWSLVGSATASVLLIVLAFRNLALTGAVALTNLVPVLLTGALIHVFSAGALTMAAGLATTIAFGIAVDDTIHFLNRATQRVRAGDSPDAAVLDTIVDLGSILGATSIVLIAGVALTLVSDFSAVRTFGKLTIAILVFALVADLVILPAMLLAFRRWSRP